MTSKDLISKYETFHKELSDNVNEWLIIEMGKISKKHNVYIKDYGILLIYDIAEDGDSHTPYSHGTCEDENLERFELITKEIEVLYEVLNDIDFNFQGMEYSNEAKFIQ